MMTDASVAMADIMSTARERATVERMQQVWCHQIGDCETKIIISEDPGQK
jgi:hypothetical protein